MGNAICCRRYAAARPASCPRSWERRLSAAKSSRATCPPCRFRAAGSGAAPAAGGNPTRRSSSARTAARRCKGTGSARKAACTAGTAKRPPRLFWRRRAKRRSGKGKGARREIGGRGSAASPPAPKAERVATGGDVGGTQNIKPPPPAAHLHRSRLASLCAARPVGA